MKKILIIQTAFIGDVVLATPIIENLHQYLPDVQIDFLLRKGNENLLLGHPHINQVIIWNKKEGKYKSLWNILREIRHNHYDYIINAQRFFTTGLLTALSGAGQTIGFDKNPLSVFFSKSVQHKIGDTHETQRNIQLVKLLTGKDDVLMKLYPSNQDFEFTKTYKQGNYICIAPTSVWFTKQYPKEKWIEFLQNISSHHKVYLLGSPADFAQCDEIISLSGYVKIENLAGKLSLLQTATLLRDAKMNFTNDSAVMHLASAMDAPVSAIFCSTIPAFGFGPLSSVSHIIETKETLSCRPCGLHGKKDCPHGHFKCAFTIDVQQLLQTIPSTK